MEFDEVRGEARIPPAANASTHDIDGDTYGAVNISGDTSENDVTCAIAGIEEAGYRPITG
jgi:hypothetical protein